MPITLAINEDHRSVLGKRNENGKIAMPVHCEVLAPWVLRTVIELSAAGMVECVGHWVPIEHETRGLLLCDIYQLTEDGERLCASHDIVRVVE